VLEGRRDIRDGYQTRRMAPARPFHQKLAVRVKAVGIIGLTAGENGGSQREVTMKMSLKFLAAAALLLPSGLFATHACGQELISTQQLRQSVDLQNVSAAPNGAISGTIVNRTGLTVRNVKLMVNYAWVWANDFRPGEDSPGRTVYITAPADIPPHGEGTVTYQPSPPLPSRSDGRFVPSVHIVGFTRMVPPT
jgi:hypothetical protein